MLFTFSKEYSQFHVKGTVLENGEVTYTTAKINGGYPLDTKATFLCFSQSDLQVKHG